MYYSNFTLGVRAIRSHLIIACITAIVILAVVLGMAYHRQKLALDELAGTGAVVMKGRAFPMWMAHLLPNNKHIDVIRPVVEVNFRHSTLDEHCLAELHTFTRLNALWFSYTRFRGSALSEIGNLVGLRILYVEHSPLDDEGLGYLTRLIKLERLSLKCCDVTDNGLVHLIGIQGLRELNLFGTLVSDMGLRYIGQMDNLQFLDLRNTEVSERGVEWLQNRFPGCDIVY